MEKINGEIYFENRKEQVEYKITKNFILSFYKTKNDYRRILNNLHYLKSSSDEKAFQNFKKEMIGLLTLLSLEYPQMKEKVKLYNKNKTDTFFCFVLVDVYNIIVHNMKELGLIKIA